METVLLILFVPIAFVSAAGFFVLEQAQRSMFLPRIPPPPPPVRASHATD